MIKVDNLTYSFPQMDLYNKISFTLKDGEQCAFIGSNGTGKSTLIDMIMNPDQYLFEGKIEVDLNCHIGYVSQFSQVDDRKEITVYEYIAEEHIGLQKEIAAICTEMETASDFETLLKRYQQSLDSFQAIGGDDFESIITKKLSVANLGNHADLVLSKLSSGEFKLVQVIKEMLTAPDVMIMDEPDVFLDFEHLNALKNLINSHKGCMLVITHNRYLLNHCFNKIIHLENTELEEFNGRYLDYNFSLLQKKIELQELAVADEKEIERNKQIIDKMRSDATYFTCASRGRTLHARVSLLERLEARKVKEPFVEIKQPDICLVAEQKIEDEIVLKVDDYSVAFQNVLLDHVSFEMKSTDKVALIGPNGTGKTTLLREIFKNKNHAIKIHEDATISFLSQMQGDMLNGSNTILEEFLMDGFETKEEILRHLSDYGFGEELLNQKIEALSGGEKNLLKLAKISKYKANLLLLDEPTSHLDMYSQIALEKAIENYNGAVLMISHDFYTIANCMDYVLLIEDKKIRKVSIRKFRKMIYSNHFDKDYLEIEQKKKVVETNIALALQDTDFELAKVLSNQLEALIKLL